LATPRASLLEDEMRVLNWMRPVLAASLALPYVSGIAQDITYPELVKGEKLAATMNAADLPDDFKAVKLKVTGESGFSDIFSGPYGMLMAFSGGMRSSGGNDAAQMEFVSMLELSWTKGETVHVLSADAATAKAAGVAKPGTDDEYLVTYKAELGLPQLMSLSSGGKQMPAVLKLSLVKLTSISSITPAPDVTKERLVKAFESTASFASSGSMVAEKTVAVEEPGTQPADAKQTAQISNGKQIALGTIMYCSDYDDILPYVNSVVTVKEVTAPYMRNNDLWKSLNPASEWRFNMCVGGVSMTDIPEPADTPLFYESAPWPDGRRVVAFCDGHVKLVDGATWDGMAKYLKLKLKRTAKQPLPLHMTGFGPPEVPKEPVPQPAGIGGR
jgi:prepilin-type processing-associated H-X9-DG protein